VTVEIRTRALALALRLRLDRRVQRRPARTDAAADLRLDVSGLGSVYLGGFTFGDLVRGSRAEELTEGAAVRADRLFGTGVEPWCAESSSSA
jgi:hypothetical protein